VADDQRFERFGQPCVVRNGGLLQERRVGRTPHDTRVILKVLALIDHGELNGVRDAVKQLCQLRSDQTGAGDDCHKESWNQTTQSKYNG
jgi:hypothetical protein